MIHSEPQMFTEMEGTIHLQKSNIIVHWFLDGEIGVYDDGFDGERLLPWLYMAQVIFSSSDIQSCCTISMNRKQ